MSVPADLPRFEFDHIVLDYNNLKYNPVDDVIFPSIIRTDRIPGALGTFYMYYAPHNAPGGICLAYANQVEGPWTEHPNNPLILKDWDPHHRVSHISSPHVIWDEQAGRWFLYYHGENDCTRMASSTDGLTFTYECECVTTKMFHSTSESSYARVFKHTMPSKGNKYVMFLMGNDNNTRKIYLAWSNDGKKWDTRKEALVLPQLADGVQQAGGPTLVNWGGKYYIIYHGDKAGVLTDLHITEVGPDLDRDNYLGVYFNRLDVPQGYDRDRVSDPHFFEDAGKLHLFVALGRRLHQNIALLKRKV